jgi:hypothetical protein
MNMKIENSLDWHGVHSNIRLQIQQLGYNPDLQRLLNNITNMVTELSKLEVTFRRTHKHSFLDETVSEINKAIDHLEKLILMAKLMK